MLGLPTIVGLVALLSTHVQAYNIQAMLYDSNGRETRIDQTNPFLETPSIQSDDFGVMAAATRCPGDYPGNATCDSENGTSRITPSATNNVNLNATVLLDCEVAKPLKCSTDDKKICTSAERKWRVNCNINSPAPTLRQVSAYSYEECADACDKDVSCVHVAIWGPSGDCYLKSSGLNPATDGTLRDYVIWLEPLAYV
ncbi:hypothetical protein OEA41_003376 [Lepraria neglecta]|uniref:Apple domain-containing protein n=1 Tax=Lepraria neglecta TaxID=209136 RepID=A0AAD9Z7M0_9LECA|nr:hypothetical protein OEA41_003376 [Lepraria neglecta]